MTIPAVEVQFAYRECEELTRRAAANFYYGIRLLPKEKRQAMSAVYAFARRVDDVGDEDGDPQIKLAALQGQRATLATIAAAAAGDRRPHSERGGDPVAVALIDAQARFELPLDALELLIEGVELDLRDTHYETFDELVVYCRAVAGSIGRLCLAIFADGDSNGHADLADDLGVAMQLTNILRDVREDHQIGRVYLPAEDLRRFDSPPPPEISAELISFEAARAGEWFERGLGLLEFLDARSASCVLAMTGIYRRILDRITADPEEIVWHRISLPAWEKGLVAARSLARARNLPGARSLARVRT
jgi:15-cis-phytoene synthase